MSTVDGMKHEVVNKLKNATDQLLSLFDYDDYDDSLWDEIPDIHTVQHAFQILTVIVKIMRDTFKTPHVGGASEDVRLYWRNGEKGEGVRVVDACIDPNSPNLTLSFIYVRNGERNTGFFRNQSVHQLIEWLRWLNGTGVAPAELKAP